jgi:hypothetical protein
MAMTDGQAATERDTPAAVVSIRGAVISAALAVVALLALALAPLMIGLG